MPAHSAKSRQAAMVAMSSTFYAFTIEFDAVSTARENLNSMLGCNVPVLIINLSKLVFYNIICGRRLIKFRLDTIVLVAREAQLRLGGHYMDSLEQDLADE